MGTLSSKSTGEPVCASHYNQASLISLTLSFIYTHSENSRVVLTNGEL